MIGQVLLRGAGLWLPALLLALLVGDVGTAGPPTGLGGAEVEQRETPTRAYFNAFTEFYEGEYKDALDAFLAEGRGAIKTVQTRWIDSICYHTMTGECYYHMGELQKALEHYTSALQLYVAFSDWMIRVQLPPAVRAAGPGVYKQIPWGQSSRQARLGQYPTSMLIAQGRLNNNDQYRFGGVVQPPVLFPINVQEIVRCTVLAIRRRTMLMGPVCQHDPLTANLITALSRRPGPPNHWSEAWIDLPLGLALVAGGREAQALPHLQQATLAAGEFDHPLTSTALLELGRLALAQGNYQAGAKYLEEAGYAAVQYPDPGVLEEAFRYGTVAHLMANRQGIYPPLAHAIAWAKVNRLRQLQASLLLLAAENHAVLGQTSEAAKLLDEARVVIGRRKMGAGWIGARLSFLTGTVLFQQKKVAEGDIAVAAAMKYMHGGSHWLFQISLADTLYTSGSANARISARTAMDLYQTLLRDPQPADWSWDPIESLAVLVTPHPGPLEHWFEVATVERKEYAAALEIADRARRHRFFSSLAFGGRLQSLRWILGAPQDALDQQAQLARQDLLVRYPAYSQLAQQAQQIRAKLGAMPLVAQTPEALREQSQLLGQLGALSAQQEVILREMAVRREPAALVFPPLRSTAQIQKSLPEGHALLAFFATSRHLYAFLLNNQRYGYWELGAPTVPTRRLADLLRQMGHFEQNRELSLKDLSDDQWKQSAGQMLESLLKGSQADFSQRFDELVIVPDGVLWYLPFEALQVNVDKQSQALISRFRIRYVPTASLAVPDGRGRRPAGRTAVVVGQLYARESEPASRAAMEKIARVLPGTVALKSPLPAPSAVYAATFDRLIVLDDITPAEQGPYAWAPLPIDRGKPGSTLNDWLALPWEGPDEIILPGYHTAAENALKRVNPAAAGNEVFLSVCGLMASGARTLLISRWRTGGQTSYDLVREFAQELPHTSAADAWQRSVLLAADSPLNLEAEPRIKRTALEDRPKANHPFFWAGYMLVDSADGVRESDRAPDQPVLKLRKAAPAEENQDQPAPAQQKDKQ